MNILSQNFRNMLKNRLKDRLNCLTSTFVDNLMNSFTGSTKDYLSND